MTTKNTQEIAFSSARIVPGRYLWRQRAKVIIAVLLDIYKTIIPRERAGYEMIYNQRGA